MGGGADLSNILNIPIPISELSAPRTSSITYQSSLQALRALKYIQRLMNSLISVPKQLKSLVFNRRDIWAGVDNLKHRIHILFLRNQSTIEDILSRIPEISISGILGVLGDLRYLGGLAGVSWTTTIVVVVVVGVVAVTTLVIIPEHQPARPMGGITNEVNSISVPISQVEVQEPPGRSDSLISTNDLPFIKLQPPPGPPSQSQRHIPPHLILIRYIHPATSIWPLKYNQAFLKAQASQYRIQSLTHRQLQCGLSAESAMQTHLDTPPAANTRRQKDVTAKKWNGKVVLSRKMVSKDLEDGAVCLRTGVRMYDERGGMVSRSLTTS